MSRVAVLLAVLPLGFAPAPFLRPKPDVSAEEVWKRIGIKAASVGADQIPRQHPKVKGGLRIREVRRGGWADRVELRPGDILFGLHQWETLTHDNVCWVLRHPKRTSFALRAFILRDGEVQHRWLSGDD